AGEAIARTQPGIAGLQKRGRVAVPTHGAAAGGAGGGVEGGKLAGAPGPSFHPGGAAPHRGTTTYVAAEPVARGTRQGVAGAREAQAYLVGSPAPVATTVALRASAGCLPGDAACAFAAGASAIAFTADGCRTVVRVAAVGAGTLQFAAPLADCTLGPGSAIA